MSKALYMKTVPTLNHLSVMHENQNGGFSSFKPYGKLKERNRGMGISIVSNFRKIERTCCQPFQVYLKITCLNGKVSPIKKVTGVTNYSIYEVRNKTGKRINEVDMRMSS